MFLNNDSSMLNVGILKKLLKRAKISYSCLKKQEMINEYNKYLSVLKIQKYYREYFYKNAVDHITLDKIEYPCFIFKTKSGKMYFYSYESIIRYIMKTGDTRDPMTRTQYPDELLERLDSSAKRFLPNVKFKSTLKIKKNPEYARRIRNRENEILSFQTRINEIKESILIAIDSNMLLWELNGIFIDNVEYLNTNSYINSITYELKILIRNLTIFDQFNGNTLKTDVINEIENTTTNETKNKIVSIINSF